MANTPKVNTFASGNSILASEHNKNFDDIYNDYNGNITNANLSGNAAITDANLAQITTTSKVSTSAITDSLGLIFQTGMIIMWSGAISAIPTGWVICDGNNSTPNLTDRFVIHADADSSGTNNVGETGGASTHRLQATESGIAAHTHIQGYALNGGTLGFPERGDANTEAKVTGGVSGGAVQAASSHTNRDKFHALAYIMKT